MSEVTVSDFARTLKVPVERLIVQLDEAGGLVWRAPEGSGLPDATNEPDASIPLRLMLQLLGPLAPDHLL